MITKAKFYNITCDRCGRLCDEHEWHIDADDISLYAEEQGWEEIGGQWYCPDCYEYDDNEMPVAKGGEG